MMLPGASRVGSRRKRWRRGSMSSNQFEVFFDVTLFIVLPSSFFRFNDVPRLWSRNLDTLADGTDNPMSGEFGKVECADEGPDPSPLPIGWGEEEGENQLRPLAAFQGRAGAVGRLFRIRGRVMDDEGSGGRCPYMAATF